MMKKSLFIFLLSLISLPVLVQAQDYRISEAKVKKQEAYLNAFMPTLYEKGNVSETIEDFKELLDEQPNNDAANYMLAKLYYKKGDMSHALTYALRAHRIDPENKWYSEYAARIYSAMKRYVPAAEIYKNLSDKYPAVQDYAVKYAYFLFTSGNAAKALEVIRKAEKNYGFEVNLSLKKISILEALHKADAITAEWKKLINVNPADMNWRLNLAKHYLNIGQVDKARESLDNILVLDPGNVRAQLALSQLGADATTHSDSELTAIIHDDSKSIDLKINMLLGEMDKIHPDSTTRNNFLLSLAENLTEQYPQNAKAWSMLGDLAFNIGHTAQATDAYKQATQLTMSVYTVWAQYLHCLNYIGDYADLKKAADNALMYFPNQALNYYLLASANARSADYSTATSQLFQADMMAGENYALLQKITALRAYIASAQEKSTVAIDKAVKTLQKSEEITPEAFYWVLEAYSLLQVEPVDQVLQLIRDKSLELGLTMNKYYVTALYYFIKEDYKPALEAAVKCYSFTGFRKPQVSVLIGDIYQALKQNNLADKWYSNAIKQGISQDIISPRLKQIGK